MDNQQANLDKLWIACFVETEGSIGFGAQNYNPKDKRVDRLTPIITISNTDIGLIDRAAGILKSWNVGYYINTRKDSKYPNAKIGYVINSWGFKRAQKLLGIIYPYIYGEKKRKADAVLEYIRIATEVMNYRKQNFKKAGPKFIRGEGRNNTTLIYPKEKFKFPIISNEQKIKYLLECRESFRDYNPDIKHIKKEV